MMGKSLRSYLFTGLIVWLPVLVTLWVILFIVEILDSTAAILPAQYSPEALIGYSIPGFGVVLSIIILLVTGMVATNILGQKLVRLGEKILEKIPLVRSIYNSAKQVMNAIFGSNGQAFREVLLVEYPRKGMWTIAFQTLSPDASIENHIGEESVCVFVPTTPNPTAGFLMMVAKKETKTLSMSVDDALKFIISLGVVKPQEIKNKALK